MLDLILPLSIVMSLLSYGLVARWYVMPALAAMPRAKALTPLLLPHSFRHIGMAFLIPGLETRRIWRNGGQAVQAADAA